MDIPIIIVYGYSEFFKSSGLKALDFIIITAYHAYAVINCIKTYKSQMIRVTAVMGLKVITYQLIHINRKVFK
ncbi:MAG: hypothetical protein C4518_14145 [Desulfobacteraceae bacterium]|nr:MAG: hypothetical protein C4518_14145 [Desulfobacteraceae bacterium]